MTVFNYQIRVQGLIPPAMIEEFEGIQITVHPTVTIIRGPVTDQAALHGVLNRLQGLDLELVEFRRLRQGAPDDE